MKYCAKIYCNDETWDTQGLDTWDIEAKNIFEAQEEAAKLVVHENYAAEKSKTSPHLISISRLGCTWGRMEVNLVV